MMISAVLTTDEQTQRSARESADDSQLLRQITVVLIALMVLGSAVVPGFAGATPTRDAATVRESPDPISTANSTAVGPMRGSNADENSSHVVGRVTLVTGQTVTVVERNGQRRYAVDAEAQMHQVSTPQGTYVFPAGTDFSTFDRRLFDVEFLLQQNLTDEETNSIPLIVSGRRQNVSAPRGPSDVLDSVPGARRTRTLESIGAVAARVDKDEAAAAYEQFARNDRVERVSLDVKHRVALDDVANATNAAAARQRYNVSGENVTVAVLDTGIDDTHPDLDDAVTLEKDFTNENTTADEYGHGTHVAGIVAGDGTASNGTYVGMAPDADLMNVRVLNSDGWGYTSWIVDGMEYATNQSADIVSMSLGGYAGHARSDDRFLEGVQYAVEHNVTVVAAAGNAGDEYRTIGTPAIHRDVITVGASNDTGGIAWFSSRGPTPVGTYLKPDLVAPGVGVTSTASGDAGYTSDYVSYSGTSMSTPAVSGIAALVLEEHPEWTPDRVKSTLTTTADSLGAYDAYTQGTGQINATEAMDSDVLVSPGTIDFGGYTNDTTASRRVTVTNVGSQNRTLNVSQNVTNVLDTGPGKATVNRSRISLTPGESATLKLTVDTNVSNGIYSGRLTFDGEYTAIFGYVRASELTVRKEGIDNTSVTDDFAYLVSDNTTRTGSGVISFKRFSNETVEYRVIRPGRYNLLSAGRDERNDQPIGMSRTLNVTGNRAVTLDEADTAKFSLNASEVTAEHGPLLTRSVEASYGKRLASGGMILVASFNGFPDARTARFSNDSRLNVTVERVLVPKAYVDENRSAPQFDSPVVYHLLQTSAGVSGSETKTVNATALAERRADYYRTSPSETYDVSMYSWTVDPWFDWFDFGTRDGIGDRLNQTVYVTPERGYYTYGAESNADAPEWDLWPAGGMVPDVSETVNRTINVHPYTADPYWDFDNESTDDLIAFGIAQEDQADYDHTFRDATNDTLTLRFNDTVVEQYNTTYGWVYATEELQPYTDVNMTIVGRNGATPLSTRTVTTYDTTYVPDADNSPPSIRTTDVEQLTRTGAGPNGTLVVRLHVTDRSGTVTNVTALAATGDVDTAPFTDTGLDTNNWTVGTVRALDGPYYEARIDVGNDTGPVHLAVSAEDDRENVVETTTFDAYRARDVAPLARFTATPSPANVSRSVTLNANVSIDNWGVDAYEWTFEDGTNATGEVVERTYSEFGTRTVELTVTDTRGQTDTIKRTIRVWDRYPPNASVTANRTTVEVNDESVGFDASNSTDNNAIGEYRWDFDGDGLVDANTTAPTVSHIYSEIGTYDATVRAVDENGTVGSASVAVTVEDTTPPNASFTADETTVNVSRPVTLNASDTTDNSGWVELYDWDFGDGETAFGANVTHEYAEPGTYTIELYVEDGSGNNDTASAAMTVVDEIAPVAEATANDTATGTDDRVEFDAANSTDNDDIDRYEWDFDGDGTTDETTANATTVHSYSQSGNYTAAVTVVDESGNANATDVATISVADTTSPSASVTASPTTTEIGDSVGFNASDSTDNEEIDRYEWDFDGDGTVDEITANAMATHAYADPGTYSAAVAVVDTAENADTATVNVTAEDVTSPNAVAYANDTTAELGEPVAFDGANSSDDDEVAEYAWDFDNDSATDATGAEVTHSFATKGEYDVVLTVTDPSGNDATDTLTVLAGNFDPAADAGANKTVLENEYVELDGTNSTDRDEDPLSYQWDQIEGKRVKLHNETTATPDFTAPKTNKRRELVFEVTVTDDDGATDTDTVTVYVEPSK